MSDADIASERAVRDALARAAPGVAFFGEESGGERADVGWLVDPLDGTANFVHGFPAVGVSIGLVADGEPVVGVVHAPLLGDTYSARRGGGAFRDGAPHPVSDRPSVSGDLRDRLPVPRQTGAARRVLAGVRAGAARRSRTSAAPAPRASTSPGPRRACFDGYFEPALGTWDVAAGGLLVREAGGVVTDWSGDDRAWLASGDIVAAPPAVHAGLLELMAM